MLKYNKKGTPIIKNTYSVIRNVTNVSSLIFWETPRKVIRYVSD